MIFINRGDADHECLTEDELQERYPGLHETLHQPKPYEFEGRELARMRRQKNMSLRELAKAADWPLVYVSELEHGRHEVTEEIMTRYVKAAGGTI